MAIFGIFLVGVVLANPVSAYCRPTTMTIRMESWNLARAELNMQVSSMEVQTQRSTVPCTMGLNFGFETDRVWVDQGCQADFLVTLICPDQGTRPTTRTIKVESWDYKYAERRMQVSSMTVSRRHSDSPCIMGESFGFDGQRVWVDKGCRADFTVTTIVRCQPVTKTVRVESRDLRYTERRMKVSSMELSRQHSQSPCVMGDSFGFDVDRVWADKGCRADFLVTTEVCV